MTRMTIDLNRHPSLAADEALAFSDRAERATVRLDELHEEQRERTRPGINADIARTHQELGLSLKLAEVHATLAVADAVDRLYLGLCSERIGRH